MTIERINLRAALNSMPADRVMSDGIAHKLPIEWCAHYEFLGYNMQLDSYKIIDEGARKRIALADYHGSGAIILHHPKH